jgi:hypothetical protein
MLGAGALVLPLGCSAGRREVPPPEDGSDFARFTGKESPEMQRFQVRVLEAMAIVVLAAITFAFYAYRDRPLLAMERAHEAALAVFVVALFVSALATRAGRRRWRPFWCGLALFACIYLAIGLKMGWGVSNHEQSASLLFRWRIALPLGLLCGMATQWLMTPNPLTARGARADCR